MTGALIAPTTTCDVCSHEMSRHDPIATRFCDATSNNALTRACICRLLAGGVSPAAPPG